MRYAHGVRWLIAGATVLISLSMTSLSAEATPATGNQGAIEMMTVTPQTALFDVTLFPGDSAVATAELHSNAASELRVQLAPERTRWQGDEKAFDSLWLSTQWGSDCTTEAKPGTSAAPMREAMTRDLGVLPPGETVNVCLTVSYPSSANVAKPSVSTVDLVFLGFERGETLVPPLPSTGAGGALRLVCLGIAGLMLIAGTMSFLRRRNPSSTEPRSVVKKF